MLSGKVLGKRYRIGERIGGGGMAVVYKADDIMLGRTVAVKVLRSQFAGDEEFVRRFRREAQSVASLSHAGIVSIYDVGEDQGLHYIVMELVEGETLKQLIDREAPLPPAQIATIGMQILDAIEAAHQRRIIHRDIKPHNILITRDGRIKVTDFGIARATGMDTQTNTGSIMGSAHYFSPEQARGAGVGEKSDLYSVGVVLYEMVTGSVPFQGDSPISVALKHVQEEVTPAGRLNAQVPVELDEIILRALEKDPEDRFESAGHMRTALARFKEDLLAGRTHQGAGEFPTQDLRALREAQAKRPAGRKGPKRAIDEEQERKAPWGWIIGGLSALLVIALGIFGYIKISEFMGVPDVHVPSVVGLSFDQANKKLQDVGLAMGNISYGSDPTAADNTVLRQDPVDGATVKEGRKVDLVLAKGKDMVVVPPLTNLSQDDAVAKLQAAGLKLGDTTPKYSDKPQGTVIDQSPSANSMTMSGSQVSLTVSSGALHPPNVMGKTVDVARQLIESYHLKVKSVVPENSTLPKDTITRQDPAPTATVQEGDEITLYVSSGQSDGTTPPPGTQTGPTDGQTTNPPAQNSDGSKTATVQIQVEGVAKQWTVQVIVSDDIGEKRVVYTGQHLGGTSFPLAITYKTHPGSVANYKVMINGLLSKWGDLP